MLTKITSFKNPIPFLKNAMLYVLYEPRIMVPAVITAICYVATEQDKIKGIIRPYPEVVDHLIKENFDTEIKSLPLAVGITTAGILYMPKICRSLIDFSIAKLSSGSEIAQAFGATAKTWALSNPTISIPIALVGLVAISGLVYYKKDAIKQSYTKAKNYFQPHAVAITCSIAGIGGFYFSHRLWEKTEFARISNISSKLNGVARFSPKIASIAMVLFSVAALGYAISHFRTYSSGTKTGGPAVVTEGLETGEAKGLGQSLI